MPPVKPTAVRWFLLALLLTLPLRLWAFEPFVVETIRVEGLQRIAVGTVFNYLPLKRGDRVDAAVAAASIRALFKTEFFQDVVLEREGSDLVVFVKERPAIASIKIEGNEEIPSEQLTENLKKIGFSEGRVFVRSMLEKVEQELRQQYLAQGRYNVRIRSTVKPLERNRVDIHIEVAEGDVSTVRAVNIIGNHSYEEGYLLGKMEMDGEGDDYSKQLLAADIETLRSFYMDNGYINFNIDSTLVAISPDRKDVYITHNISEGERFTVSEVNIEGETIIGVEKIRPLISVKAGDVFSRREVMGSSERISEKLGDIGYAFANVNPIPDVDKEARTVRLTYAVDPGRRVYARRINLSGNLRTRDEVLRREFRQLESGWVSTEKVKRSQTRLNRLGYFDDVTVKTPAVPGTPDLVDVEVDVAERATFGSLNLGIGYGDVQGILLNASVTQENFLGTGKRFTLSLNDSQVSTVYNFSFTDPYYSLDGVSLSYNFFYRTTDSGAANVSDYTTDTYGAALNFGVPVSEYDTFRWGLSYEYTKLNTNSGTSQEILDFCNDAAGVGNRCDFDTYKWNGSWVHDTRNRAIFPNKGGVFTFGTEVALPVDPDGLTFYKPTLSEKNYLPVGRENAFYVDLEVGYAAPYGESEILPPFERFHAGGIRSVRGYRTNSLGGSGTFDSRGDPLGGDLKLLATMEFQFPPPWTEESKSMRLSAFVDGGNVFDTAVGVDLGELRYSSGLAMSWMTPVGPLIFSYARPLNEQPGDEVERFQFTLGIP